MMEYNKDSFHQNFEDYYETSEKVNVRINLNIESIYENNALFSTPSSTLKQSIQIQPFIQFKKCGLLKLYFKIVDFNNPHNTTIINSEVEMTQKSLNDSTVSNSDCYLREITTGSQSMDEDELSDYERAKQFSRLDDGCHNIINKQYETQQQLYNNQLHSIGKDSAFSKVVIQSKQQAKAGVNMITKKSKKNDEKYHQKQKRRELSASNYQYQDESDVDIENCDEKDKLMRNSENPYKLRKTLQQQEEIYLQQSKDDLNRQLMMNQHETSQSEILFNLYNSNASQQHSPQTNSLSHSSRFKNEINTDRSYLITHQGEPNQQLSLSFKSKSSYSQQGKFDALDNNYGYNHCTDNSNNEYQDLSYSKQSLDQNGVDSSTVITRTRRNGSSVPQCLVQLPLPSDLTKKKSQQQIVSDTIIKEESNTGTCKGNAVNMAKNILKGFMEYVFVSAKEEDLIDCCITTRSNVALTSALSNSNIQEKLQMELAESDKIENENNDEDNDDGEKLDDEDQKEDLNITEGETKDQKQIIDGIRKRFKKQYNSKMLEKPSNSKLLKLFSNNNYGKLFKHYFSSEEIMKYIECSNIQNKNAHKELVEKIRVTSFDIEKLQDVLKTRIFKRPPFQKPQK